MKKKDGTDTTTPSKGPKSLGRDALPDVSDFFEERKMREEATIRALESLDGRVVYASETEGSLARSVGRAFGDAADGIGMMLLQGAAAVKTVRARRASS